MDMGIRPSDEKTARATECLWSLQEASMEIDALLLVTTDGIIWTATLDGGERTQRLAAVSSTMFLLGDEASTSWGNGEMTEVCLRLTPESADTPARYVLMRPVNWNTILILVCSTPHPSEQIYALMSEAKDYLTAVLRDEDPDLPRWHEV